MCMFTPYYVPGVIFINMIRLKQLLLENNVVPGIKFWETIWWELRKQNKSFGEPDKGMFDFGGLFFFLDETEGVLQLPPQKLSDWRDDPDKARDILDNYVHRLRNALVDLDADIRLDVNADYSMKIIKY